MAIFKDILLAWLALAGLKVLLFPAYHSTDFEVHRNWLAITGHLPVGEWYFNDTSIWTLDYPPFFAYFEWVLFQFSRVVAPGLIELERYDDNRFSVVCFQRCTVIATEVLLAWATARYLCSAAVPRRLHLLAFVAVLGSGGLILVDHIHFQYNGFLIGALVMVLSCCNQGQYAMAAIGFSIVVFLKHLFAPLALPFGIYFISAYCFQDGRFHLLRLMTLVMTALAVTGLALGPFLLQPNGVEQLVQIFQRLFPFGRGLVHTYWAPNVWALYCFADRLLLQLCSRGLLPGWAASLCASAAAFDAAASSTTGVLGSAASFAFLPAISAGVCIVTIVISMVPALVALIMKPTPGALVDSIVYCSLCTFMLGYHVHEKAILIPMLISVLSMVREARHAVVDPWVFFLKSNLLFLLTLSGTHGLFPLFTAVQETPIKIIVFGASIMFTVVLIISVPTVAKVDSRLVILWFLISMINVSLIIFTEVVYPLYYSSSGMQFLPLMMTSVLCALQNLVCHGLSLAVVLRHLSSVKSTAVTSKERHPRTSSKKTD